MRYDVPFISNTKDDLHCLQAAFMMILKYFKPTLDISWDEWSRLTGFEPGKGTYSTAGALWFHKNGFDVKEISSFDCERFIKIGGQYIKEVSGDEVGDWQIEHSNIPLEQRRMKDLLKSGVYDKREPKLADIKNYLKYGYLIRAMVNSRKLNNQTGYFGHAVIVYGYDKTNLFIHDPGLPPRPKRIVSYEKFEQAWASPTEMNKEMDAIKLK